MLHIRHAITIGLEDCVEEDKLSPWHVTSSLSRSHPTLILEVCFGGLFVCRLGCLDFLQCCVTSFCSRHGRRPKTTRRSLWFLWSHGLTLHTVVGMTQWSRTHPWMVLVRRWISPEIGYHVPPTPPSPAAEWWATSTLITCKSRWCLHDLVRIIRFSKDTFVRTGLWSSSEKILSTNAD